MINTGKPTNSEKKLKSVLLGRPRVTSTHSGLYRRLRGEKPAAGRLSYCSPQYGCHLPVGSDFSCISFNIRQLKLLYKVAGLNEVW